MIIKNSQYFFLFRCTICGRDFGSRAMAARHCGLQHDKLREVAKPEHVPYITKMKPGRKGMVTSATSPTQSAA